MKEQITEFETAKLAFKKGFLKEWSTTGFYREKDKTVYLDSGSYTNYAAPTQSLLQKWLREEHNLHPYVVPQGDGTHWNCSNIRYNNKDFNEIDYKFRNNIQRFPKRHEFKCYEDALEFGLFEALKLIK